jgi:hypothetical protein
MTRRRRVSAKRSATAKIVEVVVLLVGLWIKITFVVPLLAQNFADNAIERMRPSPTV